MRAPEYERAAMIKAAVETVAGSLRAPIDRVKVKADRVCIQAGAKRKVVGMYYKTGRDANGAPWLGGSWRASGVDLEGSAGGEKKVLAPWELRLCLLVDVIDSAAMHLSAPIDEIRVRKDGTHVEARVGETWTTCTCTFDGRRDGLGRALRDGASWSVDIVLAAPVASRTRPVDTASEGMEIPEMWSTARKDYSMANPPVRDEDYFGRSLAGDVARQEASKALRGGALGLLVWVVFLLIVILLAAFIFHASPVAMTIGLVAVIAPWGGGQIAGLGLKRIWGGLKTMGYVKKPIVRMVNYRLTSEGLSFYPGPDTIRDDDMPTVLLKPVPLVTWDEMTDLVASPKPGIFFLRYAKKNKKGVPVASQIVIGDVVGERSGQKLADQLRAELETFRPDLLKAPAASAPSAAPVAPPAPEPTPAPAPSPASAPPVTVAAVVSPAAVALRGLLEDEGRALLRNRDRCTALMADALAGYPAEAAVLRVALSDGVPEQLLDTRVPPQLQLGRLAVQLERTHGIATGAARAAVEAWAYALRIQTSAAG